jgi:hypothetical protein
VNKVLKLSSFLLLFLMKIFAPFQQSHHPF